MLYKLVDKIDLKLNKDFPMDPLNELQRDKRQSVNLENWRYYAHRFHCGFENNITGQIIQVPLVFGKEFRDLDPYFFSKFIKSTPTYKLLPVEIFEDYADGGRINERMLILGKFEKISSNISNHHGVVVADRQQIEIKSYLDWEKM